MLRASCEPSRAVGEALRVGRPERRGRRAGHHELERDRADLHVGVHERRRAADPRGPLAGAQLHGAPGRAQVAPGRRGAVRVSLPDLLLPAGIARAQARQQPFRPRCDARRDAREVRARVDHLQRPVDVAVAVGPSELDDVRPRLRRVRRHLVEAEALWIGGMELRTGAQAADPAREQRVVSVGERDVVARVDELVLDVVGHASRRHLLRGDQDAVRVLVVERARVLALEQRRIEHDGEPRDLAIRAPRELVERRAVAHRRDDAHLGRRRHRVPGHPQRGQQASGQLGDAAGAAVRPGGLERAPRRQELRAQRRGRLRGGDDAGRRGGAPCFRGDGARDEQRGNEEEQRWHGGGRSGSIGDDRPRAARRHRTSGTPLSAAAPRMRSRSVPKRYPRTLRGLRASDAEQ